jgi:membrane fusion protein (multidrug efflux system)
VATDDWSKRALMPLRAVGRQLRRVASEPRDFIAIPVPRPAGRVRIRNGVARAAVPPRKSRVGWLIAGAVFLLVATPIAMWIHYESDYVMSRNAMVRGQLAEIGARLDGVVTRVEVDTGQRVTAGQVLVRMEDRHFRAEAQQAQAELDGLRRELEAEHSTVELEERRLRNELDESEANLSAAAAQVEAAKSRADDARGAYLARKGLLPTGAVSKESVRDALAKTRTANAMTKAAQAELAAARAAGARARLEADSVAIHKQRLGVLEASVRRAEARLAAAQANLASTVIRAPGDGAVVRRIVEAGGSVQVGTPILSLWIGDDVWVEAWLDEDDISQVKIGSAARVTLPTFPDQEFAGTVEKIGLTTDFEMPTSEVPQPRFVRMRGTPVVGVGIRLQKPPAELLPGLSAVVGIRKPQA